jgi:hypothetical protein
MHKAATPHRWFQGWRATQPTVEHDAADLGTAFGLDLSLHEAAQKTTVTPPVARPPGWVRRLASRRNNSV